MKRSRSIVLGAALLGAGAIIAFTDPAPRPVSAEDKAGRPDPPAPSTFGEIMKRRNAAKADVQKRHQAVLAERYDLSDRPADGAMGRGKRLQGGVRAKLVDGMTWERLASMTPPDVHDQDLFPRGFMPLPHPDHPEGGMLFPKFHIDEIRREEGRDLTRFDLDFDLPDHFLPEFPAPLHLTTRTDLGDVTAGRLLTLDNFQEILGGVLNPKQIEGLRLLLTPFPQQQFNATGDRRSERPSRGVSCFDCHANGHTNASTHLAGDVRPQEFRHRLDTPSLRGVNIQRLFGSQRALKSVEDFTEFEQRAAYFDGDPALGTMKGANILDRGSQVHFMSEFQALIDFPPAPKLGIDGKLDPRKASPAEMRGQDLFFGKAKCGACHPAPYFTDNLMHDLKAERFFAPRLINGRRAAGDGPIKTFPLRGIRESPPYLHDGRLLTLEDAIEFFNLILETRLSAEEKGDLLGFLKTL